MSPIWFYGWLLLGAGFQVSAPYPTWAACEAARVLTAATLASPVDGRRIERVFPCQSAQ